MTSSSFSNRSSQVWSPMSIGTLMRRTVTGPISLRTRAPSLVSDMSGSLRTWFAPLGRSYASAAPNASIRREKAGRTKWLARRLSRFGEVSRRLPQRLAEHAGIVGVKAQSQCRLLSPDDEEAAREVFVVPDEPDLQVRHLPQ